MYNDEPCGTLAKQPTIEQAIGELSIIIGQIEDKIFLPCQTNSGAQEPMPENKLISYRELLSRLTQKLRRVNDALGVI